MDQNKELLCSIYENVDLAKDVLNKMILRCEDGELRKLMAEQFAEYHRIKDEAECLLDVQFLQPPRQSRAERAMVFASTQFNLSIDKTSSHMAEMLMQGSLMGIIDILRDLKQYKDAQSETLDLAKKLLATEERNMLEMRQYL